MPTRQLCSLLAFTFWSVAAAADDGTGGSAALLTEAAGARVHSFSSEFGSGWEAANLVLATADMTPDGQPRETRIWSSATNEPFPHWILFEFTEPQRFQTFVFNNALDDEESHPGISARNLEIWIGDRSDRLSKAVGVELERNKSRQAIRIVPTPGRFLKFVITSNWGHPWYTELGYTRVLPAEEVPEKELAEEMRSGLLRDGAVDLYGLYFDFGSARLREESAPVLQEIVALHRSDPARHFTVEGHTDNVGSAEANRALSLARAAAVVDALVALGVARDRFEAEGHGADHPVASNETDQGRAKNRRVTLRAVGPAAPQ